MSKVAKLIFVILSVLIVFSIFVTLSTLSQKTALEKTKANLESELAKAQDRENKLLIEKKKLEDDLKAAKSTEARLQGELNRLSDELDKLTEERDDWKSRVDSLRQERDQLMAKLQEKPQAFPPSPEKVEAPEIETAEVKIPEMPELPEGEMADRYWAEVLKEKASLEMRLGEFQTEISSQAVAVEELKKKNSDLELELSLLKNQKEELERKIKYSEDLANTLSIELAREKNDKRYVGERLDKLKEENLSLRSQVKELTSAKVALEKSIAKLSEDKENITRRLAETESVIQNRIDEVMDIKRSLDKRLETSSTETKEVELPPIIVSAPPSSAQPSTRKEGAPGFDGRILSINEENNFVVIDLGEEAGVGVGDTLNVYRGSKYIAGLEVIQVRKDISAADIKQKVAKIQVGDVVR